MPEMSNDLEKLTKFIKYRLSELASENKHHDFELLCFHLARLKICSNIVPVTGPVSGGGDGGIDFKHYEVEINKQELPEVSQVGYGLINNNKVEFACSLRKDFQTKIKEDIAKIKNNKPETEIIYFFSNQDIKEGDSLKLEKWANDTHKVHLFIFDINAIANKLSEFDTFWISQKYLDIDSDQYPRSKETSRDDYDLVVKKWKSQDPTLTNFYEFYEIKEAAREALLDADIFVDLNFWLENLEKIALSESPWKLNAAYEYICLTMRGFRTFDGLEELIKDFIENSINSHSFGDWEKAQTVLTYCRGALIADKKFKIDKFTVINWQQSLLKRVDEALNGSIGDSTRARLLLINASLIFDPNNIEEFINIWEQIIKLIPSAPMLPVQMWSNLLGNDLYDILKDYPKFEEIVEKLEYYTAEREKGYSLGSKARERALKFYKDKNIVKGIKELHKARIRWSNKEMSKGLILTLMLLSNWYTEIGFLYLAKRYALAAAFIVLNTEDDGIKEYLPSIIEQVADIEYSLGHYINYIFLADLVNRTIPLFQGDTEKFNTVVSYEKLTLYTVWILKFAEIITPEIKKDLIKNVEGWLSPEEIEELLNTASVKEINSLDKIKELLDNKIFSDPFSDLGDKITYRWKIYGINFEICWDNNFNSYILAEEFVSILQGILFELIDKDLYLLKTNIKISIVVNDTLSSPEIKFNNSIEEENAYENLRAWEINIPPSFIATEQYYTAFIAQIISDISLLNVEQITRIFSELFENDAIERICPINSYKNLYAELYSTYSLSKITKYRVATTFSIKLDEINLDEFEWKDTPVSQPDKEIILDIIKKRYQNAIRPIQLSIKRWKEDPNFVKEISRLRATGMKDWYILSTLCQIVINRRVKNLLGNMQPGEEFHKAFTMFLNKDEDNTDLFIPFDQITNKEIDLQANSSTLAMLGSYDLSLNHDRRTPVSIKPVIEFLRIRTNFFEADIEHSPIFE